MRFAPIWIAVPLCWTAVVQAEPLADLRARLAQLQGQDAISATLEATQNVRKDATVQAVTGHATLALQAGAQGLQLTFPPELLQQAQRETQARVKNPELPTPTNDLLRDATALEIGKLLRYSDSLMHALDGATLKESRADTFDGKPAQLLVLDVPGHMSVKDKEDLKHFQAQLKVWLDADGAPLASEETYNFSGRKFLIGFEGSESVSARFAIVGARLVALLRTSHATFSGFGQDNDTSTTTTLSLK